MKHGWLHGGYYGHQGWWDSGALVRVACCSGSFMDCGWGWQYGIAALGAMVWCLAVYAPAIGMPHQVGPAAMRARILVQWAAYMPGIMHVRSESDGAIEHFTQCF